MFAHGPRVEGGENAKKNPRKCNDSRYLETARSTESCGQVDLVLTDMRYALTSAGMCGLNSVFDKSSFRGFQCFLENIY